MPLMDNKTFYDNLYRADQEKTSFEISSKAEAFKRLVKVQHLDFTGKAVLDLGFGPGNILFLLRKLGAICYGAEISQTAIDNLKNQGFFLKYTNGDKLPYDSECFDAIVASHTIEHIPDEKRILQEIKRVLKRDGIFIMGVPTGKTGYNPLHFRDYSEKDIRRLSEQLDSTCVCHYNFGGPFFYFFYRIINYFIRIIFSSNNDSSLEVSASEFGTKHSVLRDIYQNTVVIVLLMLYIIDMHLGNHDGIEIWYVFKKNK